MLPLHPLSQVGPRRGGELLPLQDDRTSAAVWLLRPAVPSSQAGHTAQLSRTYFSANEGSWLGTLASPRGVGGLLRIRTGWASSGSGCLMALRSSPHREGVGSTVPRPQQHSCRRAQACPPARLPLHDPPGPGLVTCPVSFLTPNLLVTSPVLSFRLSRFKPQLIRSLAV